jgi:hypothetical protein
MGGNMQEFAITVAKDGGLLRITLRGPSTRENLLEVLTRIVADTKSQNVWRVLLDARDLSTSPSTQGRYELGVEFARLADRRMSMAVVGRAEMVDHFFETVARNRGGAVRVFTDETDALHWLLGATAGSH